MVDGKKKTYQEHTPPRTYAVSQAEAEQEDSEEP